MIVGQLGYLAGPLVSDRRSLPQASGFDLFPLRENAFLLALPEIVWARNRLLPFLAFDEEVTNPLQFCVEGVSNMSRDGLLLSPSQREPERTPPERFPDRNAHRAFPEADPLRTRPRTSPCFG